MTARLAFAFLGGCIGGALRLVIGILWDTGAGIPWQLLTINVIGSFAIGVVAALWGGHHHVWPLLGPGLLGGFTTFSSFSLDFAMLCERGAIAQAALYVLGSVGISLVAIFFGLYVGRAFG